MYNGFVSGGVFFCFWGEMTVALHIAEPLRVFFAYSRSFAVGCGFYTSILSTESKSMDLDLDFCPSINNPNIWLDYLRKKKLLPYISAFVLILTNKTIL